MENTINKIHELLEIGKAYIGQTAESKLSSKPSPEKWSKKEILGHLVDSGVNNLRRFTEIQFQKKPYSVKNYNQDLLVKVNDYQNASTQEILNFWIAVNTRIINIIKLQKAETLDYQIILEETVKFDLKFLIEDYVHHLEHHIRQILKK
jgi:hypothetical protein